MIDVVQKHILLVLRQESNALNTLTRVQQSLHQTTSKGSDLFPPLPLGRVERNKQRR